MTSPVLINKVEPIFSEAVRKVKFRGLIILKGVINKTGDIETVYIVKGSGNEEIDSCVIKAVAQWKYRPAMKEGNPVKVYSSFTVNIRL
jgi:periplasmic protein TonB